MKKLVDHRLIKMVDEILVFLYSLEPSDIHMDLKRESGYSELIFEAQVARPLEAERIKKLERLLSVPRRREVEETYWELSGNDTTPSAELCLIGAMSDDHELRYDAEAKRVYLMIRRDK